jgi:MFS family permease
MVSQAVTTNAMASNRLITAQALSSLGTAVSTIALSIMVFDLTGSVFQFGGVMAASTLPLVVASLIGGALLDRFSAKTLMVVADIFRAGLISALPFVADVGLVFIYLVAALIGMFSAIFNPAQVKIVSELTDQSNRVRMNSYMSVSRDGAELFGYLTGAVLVGAVGYSLTFVMDAASYLVSGLLLFGLPRLEPALAPRTGVFLMLRETPAAAMAVIRRPAMRTNLLLSTLGVVAIMAALPNCNALVIKVFERGAWGLAAQEVLVSSGMIVGGLVVSRMALRGDKNGYVAFSLAAMGVCLFFVGLSSWFWISICLMALAGMANVLTYVPSMTLFQELPDNGLKGRIIAIRTGFGQLGATTGLLAGGWVGSAIGIKNAFLVAGALGVALTLLIYLPVRVASMKKGREAWRAALSAGASRVEAKRVRGAILSGTEGVGYTPSHLHGEASRVTPQAATEEQEAR